MLYEIDSDALNALKRYTNVSASSATNVGLIMDWAAQSIWRNTYSASTAAAPCNKVHIR
jgi:hypothetical protein